MSQAEVSESANSSSHGGKGEKFASSIKGRGQSRLHSGRNETYDSIDQAALGPTKCKIS